MTLEALAMNGRSQVSGSMAAVIGDRISEVRKPSLRDSLGSFHNIPHRMEHVAYIHGVQYINDSGATKTNVAWFSLQSIHTPVIWIAGGIDKGNDYTRLKQQVIGKVKALICIGLDNLKLISSFAGMVPVIEEAASMEEAVMLACKNGIKGDTVLLSPACPSFDQFSNYEERGDLFRSIVKSL